MTICILDHDPDLVAAKTSLERAGFLVVTSNSPQDALEKIRLSGIRVLLADPKAAAADVGSFLAKALQRQPGLAVLLMSSVHSVDTAIDAIKRGAYDFLCKPLDYPRLMKTLDELAAHIEKPQSAVAGENWRPLPLSEMRRIHIRRVLETCNGNRVRAARMLGIGRTSLYRFLKSSDNESAARIVA